MALELVASNKGPLPYQTLRTDSLIESIFNYILAYTGDECSKIGDVYATSLQLFDKLTRAGYPAGTYMYDTEQDIWRRRTNYIGIKEFRENPCYVFPSIKQLFDPIRLMYQDLHEKDPEIPLFTDQDIFHNASYLLAESFLRHLEGEKTPVNFPPIMQVLQRENLDDFLEKSLQHPKEFVFCPISENFNVNIKIPRDK